jgi:hypothetical protein
MSRRVWLPAASLAILAFLSLLIWSTLYPGPGDPKNIKYVLWKRGLYPLDPGIALETMIGDREPDRLIVGKSKEELARKFGFLTPVDQGPDYYRRAAADREVKAGGSNILLLRRGPWLVVFSEGRASELVLLKGF